MRRGALAAVAALALQIPAVGYGDEVAPVVTLDKGPRKQSNKAKAKFKFSANEPVTFECSLDGEDFMVCSSPYMTPKLKPHRHTFELRATDATGNRSGTAIYKWKVKRVE